MAFSHGSGVNPTLHSAALQPQRVAQFALRTISESFITDGQLLAGLPGSRCPAPRLGPCRSRALPCAPVPSPGLRSAQAGKHSFQRSVSSGRREGGGVLGWPTHPRHRVHVPLRFPTAVSESPLFPTRFSTETPTIVASLPCFSSAFLSVWWYFRLGYAWTALVDTTAICAPMSGGRWG